MYFRPVNQAERAVRVAGGQTQGFYSFAMNGGLGTTSHLSPIGLQQAVVGNQAHGKDGRRYACLIISDMLMPEISG